ATPITGPPPVAATPSRRLHAANFAFLVELIQGAYDAHIIITTGPREGELATQVAAQMSHSPIIVNQATPMQLAALLQRCNLYISNDTGPMHLSTAVKTPTIALFGASNLIQWAPPWDRHAVVARKGCEFMKTLSSKEWDTHTDRARENFEAITPDAVMATVEKITW
ncbi:glycosyltransferase family 9 protein, partial [Candidatus Poribacteria bacterium]|nr:glycosyltransferase family 9 protein [Candidatus Poribacteria bacterium]